MKVQKFVFRAQKTTQNDVYVVREKGKYGLITMPNQGDKTPDSLSLHALREQGGSFITQPQWDDIRPNICFDPNNESSDEVNESGNITCNYYFLKNGLWGILDETGFVIQEPTFEEVIIVNCYENDIPDSDIRDGFKPWTCSTISGRVVVRKGDKWGMLRGNGVEILPMTYDFIGVVSYYLSSSDVYIICQNGLYGVVDQTGKILIPMVYPSLLCEHGLDYMWDCSIFRIDSEAGTGYVRLGDGKCVVAPEWDRIDVERLYLGGDAEPYGHIYTVWKDGRCGLILDNEGMIIPPAWDEIIVRRFVFEDPLSYSVRRGDRWGCCDADGRLICDALWDEVDVFINGMACVKKDGQWGAIGADGQLRIPTEWDEIEGFGVKSAAEDARTGTNTGALLGLRRCEHTTLPSRLSWVQRNGLWGLIDRNGTVITEPAWEGHDGTFAFNIIKKDSEWMELEVCIDICNEDVKTEETTEASDEIGYHIEIRRIENGK